MRICIATIRNSQRHILKYRILNTDTHTIDDIHLRSIHRFVSTNKVANLDTSGDTVRCTDGNIDDYPILIQGVGVRNNIPIIISKSDDEKITIANYEGKIVKLPIEAFNQKISKTANTGVQSKPEVKHQTNTKQIYDILSIVRNTPTRSVSIQGFNMLDHYKKLGVSDSILKKPSQAYRRQERTNNTTLENDTEAYKFELVKAENRLELRKYHGKGYTGKVVIPPGVTHICKEAFVDAEAKELEMPDTVIFLGEKAFYNSGFENIKISKNITAIPLQCFMGSEVKLIDLTNITSIDNMAFCESKIEKVNLKSNIIQIGFAAFKDCSLLSEFTHEKTIKKIRHHAFENCINLTEFEFESVMTIEQCAFNCTGLTRAKVNGEVNYLQTSTFTGDIEEITLLDGIYKISANSVSNTKNKPIVWTIPNSATNIEKGAFKSQDTVICYRKSVAASSALIAECNIVYLDDYDSKSVPNVIKKASLIDASVEDILKDTLKSILSKDNMETTYEVDEEKLSRANIPQSILDLIGCDFADNKYATDEDIDNEGLKFRCILDHLSRVAKFDITPFSTMMLTLKDTFYIKSSDDKLEELYNDGKSRVIRVKYVDNKYTSISSSFLVAKTYDTLRFICMDNRNTDIMCENPEVQDLTAILNILRPGDTIGLNSVVSGVKYPEIAAESPKKIQIKKGNNSYQKNIKMNIYQALRYSSVTVKLDNNNIALLLPGNKKIIKCASLGKTVWQNEKEDTYKSVQCTIADIADIGGDILDYESTLSQNNHGALIKRFRSMNENQYQQYIETYSHIYVADKSMYKHAGEYAEANNMTTIEDLDIDFMEILFKTSLFEQRQDNWLEGSIGKTIVPDAHPEFVLADGSVIYQYRTVKKTALRNKLMHGGDRKLYIFELIDSMGYRVGIYISLYDISTLVDMCLGLSSGENKVFKNIDSFDVVDGSEIIEIAPLCRESEINLEFRKSKFIFAVYKPNGLYYIGLKSYYSNGRDDIEIRQFDFIPLMQIGELDVALAFIEDSNKYGLSADSMKYLYDAGLGALYFYFKDHLGKRVYLRYSENRYLALLKARELCINGVSDISKYNRLRLNETIKRSLGYSDKNILSYKEKKINDEVDAIGLTDKDAEELLGLINSLNLSAVDVPANYDSAVEDEDDEAGDEEITDEDFDIDMDDYEF